MFSYRILKYNRRPNYSLYSVNSYVLGDFVQVVRYCEVRLIAFEAIKRFENRLLDWRGR